MNQTPKQYRLKQNLPTAKAGSIFRYEEGKGYYSTKCIPGTDFDFVAFSKETMDKNPEWFEVVK